ncbi:MAG: tRNA pseudouridine(38-40) synthase TruA [Clostridiales bacterium]|nr:tRNA pseudouridine(38-40) synthase TruA [Clostridiales bacterium]
MRLAIICEYDGTDFVGFQSQVNGRAVADVLAQAATELYKQDIKITGCSRTDAGVHARGHLSHMDVPFEIPEDKIPLAMNALLPDDVSVVKAFYVGDDFSARFSNYGKRYIYRVYYGRVRHPLYSRYAYFDSYDLDIDKMKKAAEAFAGEHDFEAFCAAGSTADNYVRRLYGVEVRKSEKDPFLIEIEVAGEAFLYNMVRIIAGTLVEVGEGKINPEDVAAIIGSRDRKKAGRTLPAEGLTLEEVFLVPQSPL